MNAHRSALQSYGQAARTVSPGPQVVMLYDGILKCLGEARLAIEENRIVDRFNALKRASDIVNGLSSSLDFENGGEIAPMLERFYNYVFFRLQRASMESSIAIVDEIAANVSEMRAAWAQVAEQPAPSAAPEPQPAAGGAGSVTVSA
ncbi:MAG: flagellar export chaperone FliS [Inquilinus sp.]|nr:flagellar export chaperone FliS [Inquilinus sp.]